MQHTTDMQRETVYKVLECLKELGFEPESRLSEHEGLVHARKEMQGKCVRVVMHVSDREARTTSSGFASADLARSHLTQASIRPSLSAQAATRYVAAGEASKNPCG